MPIALWKSPANKPRVDIVGGDEEDKSEYRGISVKACSITLLRESPRVGWLLE